MDDDRKRKQAAAIILIFCGLLLMWTSLVGLLILN